MIVCTASLAASIPATTAFADGHTQCNKFNVYSTGEFRKTSLADLDESGGISAGDRVIGFRVLVDADGNKVGERFFTGHYLEVGANGEDIRRTTEIVNVLKTGAIYTTKERISGKNLISKINGGTGEFDGAKGAVKATKDGKANVYSFRLNCPEPKAS